MPNISTSEEKKAIAGGKLYGQDSSGIPGFFSADDIAGYPPSSLELTASGSITEAQLLAGGYITNNGASGEIDIILPAVSYRVSRTVVVESGHIIEISPPSGESLSLAGSLLTADYVVDSPNVSGSMAVVTRLLIGGTWTWVLYPVAGSWVNHGSASD